MEEDAALDIFVTSDLHLGHKNIIRYCDRPFDSVEAMNAAIISNWNDVVDDNAVVYILGDLALGKIEESLSWMEKARGKKFLLPGNHDRMFSGRKKIKVSDRALYADVGIEILPEQVPLVIDDKHFGLMCHFPYEGDSHDHDRFADKRPRDLGGWVFHGHVHTAWARRGRQINVGVDVRDFTPMHVSEIAAIMDAA